MSTVLQQYVDAYTNEDVSALRSIFASDLVRQNGSDPPEDLSQALATYRGQFAALTDPRYSLANVAYDPQPSRRRGDVCDLERQRHRGRSDRLSFRQGRDRLLIDGIVIRPS